MGNLFRRIGRFIGRYELTILVVLLILLLLVSIKHDAPGLLSFIFLLFMILALARKRVKARRWWRAIMDIFSNCYYWLVPLTILVLVFL